MGRASRTRDGFHSILCPVDFSESSRCALRYAHAVATRFGSRLTVLYVNEPLLVAAASAALGDRMLTRRSASELQSFVQTTLAEEEFDRTTRVVAVGTPAEEILACSARRRADLIVVGTHGLTGADRLLVGSTTVGVLRRTNVPVLAVPRTATPPADSEDWPGDRILAAILLDSSTMRDMDRSATVVSWFGARLVLAHVVAELGTPAWLQADLIEQNRTRLMRVEARLARIGARIQKRVPTEIQVRSGDPATEIAALAASIHARLVMTMLRDRRGWFGPSRGSISYHLIAHAVTPVLALPPRWRR